MCLFVIVKVDQRKTIFSQKKIWLGFQKSIFQKNLDRKHFPEIVKNLEMSYYLLIISNLVLKLLIAIYILF
jgi:transcriptional regulator NrdR family protein